MAYSTGRNGVLKMVGGWCIAACLGVVGIAYFDEIRAGLGIKLEPGDFGIKAEVSQHSGDRAGQSGDRSDRSVVIRAGRNGHYEVRAHINGRPIDVMVDTGATAVALTYEDAQAAGVFPGAADFRHKVSTANGVARVAAVTLDQVSIGDITVRNVQAVVSEPGRLQTTLLGMSFLSKLGKAEMSRGLLTLQE